MSVSKLKVNLLSRFGDYNSTETTRKETSFKNGRRVVRSYHTTTIEWGEKSELKVKEESTPSLDQSHGVDRTDSMSSLSSYLRKNFRLHDNSFDSGYGTPEVARKRKCDPSQPDFMEMTRLYSSTGGGWLRCVEGADGEYHLDTHGCQNDPNGLFIWANDSQGRGVALATHVQGEFKCISCNSDTSLGLVPCKMTSSCAVLSDPSCIFEVDVKVAECTGLKYTRFHAKNVKAPTGSHYYLGGTTCNHRAKLCKQPTLSDTGTNPETFFMMLNLGTFEDEA